MSAVLIALTDPATPPRPQLRRPPLRGHQGLQQVGRLPARREVRGQPLPQLVERRLRGRWVTEGISGGGEAVSEGIVS